MKSIYLAAALFCSTQALGNTKFLSYALKEYGTNERSHPNRVLAYAAECGLSFESPAVPWCGSFVCYVVSRAGFSSSVPKQSGLARNWLKPGEAVLLPEPGDIVVFWRGSRYGVYGHVGFFIRYSPDYKSVYVLGGNQKDEVSIRQYPSKRLLGFRRIK